MIHRYISDQVRDALTDTPAVLVNGARRDADSFLGVRLNLILTLAS